MDRAELRRLVQALRLNLPLYAKKYLKVRPKRGGELVPLIYNDAQLKLHQEIEKQRREGKPVRIVVPKARQMGVSTYVASRFLWKALFNKGVVVFILAHISDSTNYLFDMVKRMYNNLPDPLKPKTERSNRRELKFAELDSEYALGTAGSEDIGRATNPNHLHVSEAAYYVRADEITTGLFQGVSNDAGTEIIIESTANGRSGFFYNISMRGLNYGDYASRYKTVFLPWFLMREYREPLPRGSKGFKLEDTERELMELYGLDYEQILWRRLKINDDFKGDVWKFQQEYPATVMEAFVSNEEALIEAKHIEQAAKYNAPLDEYAPKVLGVDGAGGGDRTVLVLRQGKKILWWKKYEEMNPMRLAGIIAKVIDTEDVDMVFLDVAYGYGARDRLKELGYGSKTQCVHFGENSIEEEIYGNIRAQMHDYVRQWFEEGGADIPDDEEFVKDMYMPKALEQKGSRGRLYAPKKSDIKKENDGISYDVFDALGLTFAYPVMRRRKVSRITVADVNTNRVKVNSPYMTRRTGVGVSKRPSELVIGAYL